MAVIIETMDLPESCYDCRFCVDPTNEDYYESYCVAYGAYGSDHFLLLGGGTIGEEEGRHIPTRYREPGCPLRERTSDG